MIVPWFMMQVTVHEHGTRIQWKLSYAAIDPGDASERFESPTPAASQAPVHQPGPQDFRRGDKVSFTDKYLQPQGADHHPHQPAHGIGPLRRERRVAGSVCHAAACDGYLTCRRARLIDAVWRTDRHEDVIERQLAHIEGKRVYAACHRALHLQGRVKLVRQSVDHLDGSQAGREGKVWKRKA